MILGIILASAYGAMQQGFYMIESARDNTRTSQILQGEMESLRTTNWAGLTDLDSPDYFEPASTALADYHDRYTCRRVITTNKTDQLSILLEIDWIDSRGLKHGQSYITYFSKGGYQ